MTGASTDVIYRLLLIGKSFTHSLTLCPVQCAADQQQHHHCAPEYGHARQTGRHLLQLNCAESKLCSLRHAFLNMALPVC